MKKMMQHPFHLVDPSPHPLLIGGAALALVTGFGVLFQTGSYFVVSLAGLTLLLIMFMWWNDISREGSAQGSHTKLVTDGLKWGMILFIASEVMFFFSFFWAFFHSSLSASLELGKIWPPSGVDPLDPLAVPLLNTCILLSSGVSVTWAHHSILKSEFSQAKESLIYTILLGVYFTRIQVLEYSESSFSISDAVYGSTFFVATGFHGLHVIIGAIFLAVSTTRLILGLMSQEHHFGFEAAAWYWHFVDVVWLFLFTFMYWWAV